MQTARIEQLEQQFPECFGTGGAKDPAACEGCGATVISSAYSAAWNMLISGSLGNVA
jgi:hypothetical protein